MRGTLGVTSHDQWIVYLPVLLVSVAVMVPAIIVAEKHRRMKGVFVGAVAALALSQVMLYADAHNLYVLLAALVIFFSAFNVMEASLPSLITKAAPPDAKGTATGIYSSSQFLGIFIGGIVGGWAHQTGGSAGLFALTAVIALIWLARRRHHGAAELSDHAAGAHRRRRRRQTLAARLRQVPGVAEAVVIAEEKLAYLKVDSKAFDAAKAEALAGA